MLTFEGPFLTERFSSKFSDPPQKWRSRWNDNGKSNFQIFGRKHLLYFQLVRMSENLDCGRRCSRDRQFEVSENLEIWTKNGPVSNGPRRAVPYKALMMRFFPNFRFKKNDENRDEGPLLTRPVFVQISNFLEISNLQSRERLRRLSKFSDRFARRKFGTHSYPDF